MTSAIEINNLSKAFGTNRALDHVSLSVPTGHIFGFLGPNGAGKTTLIRCLMDYIHAGSGEISILGLDAHADSAELKRSIGFLSSDIQLHPGWTGRTHIEFLARIKGRGRADELASEFDLDLSTKVGNLSSGNKQKLAIILAFLGEPKLLIMDEPTRGLDPLLQNQFYDLLHRFADSGGTVFLSSHNLTEVERLCDNVAVIRAGKVVAMEGMAEILQLRVHSVQATATKPFKLADFKLKDVEIISSLDENLSLKVRGKIDPVIKALTNYNLTNLQVSHASLEEIFMEYYRD